MQYRKQFLALVLLLILAGTIAQHQFRTTTPATTVQALSAQSQAATNAHMGIPSY